MATEDFNTFPQATHCDQYLLFPDNVEKGVPAGPPRFTCSDCGEERKHCAKGRCERCYERKIYRDTKDIPATRQRARLFGRGRGIRHLKLTLSQKEQISNQPCSLCGKEPTPGNPMCIDHDHVTGSLRGPLCNPCNGAIAPFDKYGIDEWATMVRTYLATEYAVPPIDHAREDELNAGTHMGERHLRTTLKASDVQEIRWLLAHSGWTQLVIADKYGVGKSTISNIHIGIFWKQTKGMRKPAWWDGPATIFDLQET